MTKREKIIAATVAGVVAIAGLNYIVDSMLQSRKDLETKIFDARKALIEDKRLISRRSSNRDHLANLTNTSLTRVASDADFQMNARLLDCVILAGMNPTQTAYKGGTPNAVKIGKTAPSPRDPQFMRQNCRITVAGNMAQVSKFAYLVNSSEIPLRITDMVISPVKENTDDFTVEFTISTIFLTQGGQDARAVAQGTTSKPSSAPASANAQNQNNQPGRSNTQANQQGARGNRGNPTTGPSEAR